MYTREDKYGEITQKEFDFMKKFSFPTFVYVYNNDEELNKDNEKDAIFYKFMFFFSYYYGGVVTLSTLLQS